MREATGAARVLKLGVPVPEMRQEYLALNFYAGRGAVRCLQGDPQSGWLLLEAVEPGQSLYSLEPHSSLRLAAATLQTLFRTSQGRLRSEGPTLPDLGDWFQGFQRLHAAYEGGCGPFPTQLIAQAETLYTELLASSAEQVLLHGDLHRDNLLLTRPTAEGAQTLAIDPKGIWGDPCADMAAYLRNEMERGDPRSTLRWQVALFAEYLARPPERILAWTFALTVLSAIWSWEDGEDWQPTVELAQVMAQVMAEQAS